MSWSSRRRTLYLLGVVAVVLLAAAIPVARYFNRTPTCSDGIQNQGETAPDVGGPCTALSADSLKPQALLWVRPFRVRAGEYSAVAYIDNPNMNAGVMSAPYKFSFYDANNILIAERSGTTPLVPGAITPVYAGQIVSGDRVVARAFFEFTGPLTWVRGHNAAASLSIGNVRTDAAQAMPRVSADVTNAAVTDASDIPYVVTLFDANGNAIASSRTIVPSIAAGATEQIAFTWPSPFSATPARVDILPVVAPVVQ